MAETTDEAKNVSPVWTEFIDRFHRERPGITEDILARSRSNGLDPYQWIMEVLPSNGPLLDLACGSAPVNARYRDDGWIGVDRSPEELCLAGQRGARRLVRADGANLPFLTGSFTSAACSMAVMIIQPLDVALGELSRALAPGGVAALLLPGTLPLTVTDLARYARLMVALRLSHLRYPNDRSVARLADQLNPSGLEIVRDERRRFALPIANGDDGRRFVHSLYLPGIPRSRVAAASDLAASWVGTEIGIPLRRVTLHRPERRGSRRSQ